MAREAYYKKDLVLLVETRSAREFLVQRSDDGECWTLHVRTGTRWIPYRSKREPIYTWASLDTLEEFARKIGIDKLLLEL